MLKDPRELPLIGFLRRQFPTGKGRLASLPWHSAHGVRWRCDVARVSARAGVARPVLRHQQVLTGGIVVGEDVQLELVNHVYGLVEQGALESDDLRQCEERMLMELIATYGDDGEESRKAA